MSTHYGGPVPYPLAQEELNEYYALFSKSSYYRESITYTIGELNAYLDRARLVLIELGVADVEQQCLTLLPCINKADQKLDVLLVPSYMSAEPNANGMFKHQFKRRFGQMQGNPGLPDPDNLFNDVPEEDLLDAYDTGSTNP
ncbi:MAG: hypothetical protein ACOYVG_09110 [Bacteroidota bacterium]